MEKMNDIDFIKKCVPFADGFYLKHDSVSGKDVLWHDGYCVLFLGNETPRKGLFSHLLTRTIEGINRGGRFSISINDQTIQVVDLVKMGSIKTVEIIPHKEDTAKRSAIEYVLRNSP